MKEEESEKVGKEGRRQAGGGGEVERGSGREGGGGGEERGEKIKGREGMERDKKEWGGKKNHQTF